MNTNSFTEILERELLRAIPEVFGLVSGEKWEATRSESEQLENVEHCTFHLEGSATGKFSLGLSIASAKSIAKMFLGTCSDGDVLSDDDRDACAEACRQVVGMAMDRIRPDVPGIKAEFKPGVLTSEVAAQCEARFSNGDIVVTILLFTSDIHKEAGAKTAVSDQGSHDKVVPAQSSKSADSERNLALLLDVNLAVTLRFGGRELLLKDVLELSSGSVLELDRDVHEPVDLLLKDRVIARGEVVIVDGNYGLRVSEVPVAN
jgi:flagellar motor switch protein FliN